MSMSVRASALQRLLTRTSRSSVRQRIPRSCDGVAPMGDATPSRIAKAFSVLPASHSLSRAPTL